MSPHAYSIPSPVNSQWYLGVDIIFTPLFSQMNSMMDVSKIFTQSLPNRLSSSGICRVSQSSSFCSFLMKLVEMNKMHIAGPSFSTVEFDNERILFTMQALILLHGTLDLLRLLEMHQNHVRGKIIIGRVTHCSYKSGYWSTCWPMAAVTVRCWSTRFAMVSSEGWAWQERCGMNRTFL